MDVCFTKHLIVINHKLWKFNFKSYLLFLYLLITPVTPYFLLTNCSSQILCVNPLSSDWFNSEALQLYML